MSNATEREPIKSDYADTLNALHDMQHTLLYAARRQVLCRAEEIIVSLESDLKNARATVSAAAKPLSAKPEPAGETVRLDGYSCAKCGCIDILRDDAPETLKRYLAGAAPAAKPEAVEVAQLHPILRVLAEWEDVNGSLAGIMRDEWEALWRPVAEVSIHNSPRMARNAAPGIGTLHQRALEELDAAIVAALDRAKAAGVAQGLIVGLMHGHAARETSELL